LLPVAERGLRQGGVAAAEIERLIDVIANRVHARTTRARWQQPTLAALETRGSRTEAAAAMLDAYRRQAATNVPVHRWEYGA
jgi:hypothetical protein